MSRKKLFSFLIFWEVFVYLLLIEINANYQTTPNKHGMENAYCKWSL